MTILRTNIGNAQTQDELEHIIENAEPLKENGFKTKFHSHLIDCIWYRFKTLEQSKTWCIKICESYNK